MLSLILHWRYRLLGVLITGLLTLTLYQFANRDVFLLSSPVAQQHHEQRPRVFPTTDFLAHAPGFSVIQNLFWRNGTFYFVTDQPWHIPPITQVVSLSTDRTRKFEHGQVAAKIKAIRLPPVSPEVKEQNQIGETISLEDAEREFGVAEVIEGPMIINNDDNFTAHYYHWIGEMFLGAWRVWNHYGWRTGAKLPEIQRIAYMKQYSKEEAPPDAKLGQDYFNDKPGANVWFIEKFFPGIQWDTKSTWDERAATNKTFRITTAILADRSAGHSGPSSAYKPFGDVLRLPVSPDWLVGLKHRIVADYHGPTPLTMPDRPLVLYLQRQTDGRRLVEEDHEALIRELYKLQDDGIAEVALEAFNSNMAFDEQVARISRATILVGVHGNGLTHSLWMTPTRLSAVFEFQPRACTITDYSPLATAAGIQHYLVHETDFCRPLDCPKRGCEGPIGLINGVIHLDPRVVTDEIRRILVDNVST
ncbi:Glycosyltransferase family 61 protein [Pleurotus pulmonarius]